MKRAGTSDVVNITVPDMRIAYLINQYPQSSHSFIRREILGLEAIGHTVSRFTLRRNDADLPDAGDREERDRTRDVLSVGPIGLLSATLREAFTNTRRWFRAARLTLQEGRSSDRGLARHLICLLEACVLAGWLRDGKTEHLHAHFGTNSAAVAMLAGVLTSIPYSVTMHGPEEFDRATGLGLLAKAEHSKFIVAISEFGRGQLMRWTRAADWPKLTVVRCGIDAAFLATPATPVPDVSTVVCVGRLVEQKAQLVLVEAVGLLARRGIRVDLRLVGDGPMRPDVEAAIVRHNVADRVKILGWMSAADVRAQMLAARVVAQPSLAEGLPVALMEAYALRRPVVTTQIAGIPELVEASCGWIVPPGSAERLADALAEAIATPVDRLTAMGEVGFQRVSDRHRIETEVSRLAGLLAGAGR